MGEREGRCEIVKGQIYSKSIARHACVSCFHNKVEPTTLANILKPFRGASRHTSQEGP